MHIAVIFYTDTISVSFDKPEFMWGRVVANHSFLRALCRSDECDKLSIFVATRDDIKRLEETLLTDTSNKVRIVSFDGIPAYLRENPVDALHCLDPNMSVGGHIRAHWSDHRFPVTGITHSLANDHFLTWALTNSANGITLSDGLFCTTPTAREVVESAFERLQAMHPGFVRPGTEVVPLGIDIDPFAKQTAVDRGSFGLQDDEFVVLSLARFNPHFKMDILPLVNLAILTRQRTDRPVRILLAGAADQGSYVDVVREWVRQLGMDDIFRFSLNPSDAQKVALYQAADVFISLSDNLQETFGLTIVEALAAGLPVIASDWNGYRALVDDGVSGFLVATKTLDAEPDWEAQLAIQNDALTHLFCAQTTAVDLEDACDFLVRFVEDADLTRAAGRAAAESAGKHSWDRVIPRYLAAWQRLRDASARDESKHDQTILRSSALRFSHDFARYPTSRLAGDDRFETSTLGKQLLSGERSLRLYNQTDVMFDLKIMTQILRSCLKEKPFVTISAEVGAALPADSLTISQNTLWLYKYGYLRSR